MNIESYKRLLKDIGSLSRLFSEAERPYINSRTAEYLYCKVYGAENLSRSDIAIDAKKDNLGIGVKTFLYYGRASSQKIAEFNKALPEHGALEGLDKIKKVAELRNERLRFVESAYGVNTLKYHCILRDRGRILVYEEPMEHILVDEIALAGNNLRFTDGRGKYSFNSSKSTLFKEFNPVDILFETPVKILDDPYEFIGRLSELIPAEPEFMPSERVVLPMYSHGERPMVHAKSGLNQWNAAGRPRNYNEVYLPIPAAVREVAHRLLPSREQPFELVLPNKSVLSAKVSQDNGKALMSNPNSALGEWLLREVLNLDEGELLTYEKLAEIGIDSVEITKKDGKYFANFLPLGSFDNFLKENN